MPQGNDLYIINEAMNDAFEPKSKPQNLEDTPDLAGQYAYDPYVKEEQAAVTYEKVQGMTITLDKTEVELSEDEETTLTATVQPRTATPIEWSSSDETVATVEDGTITGLAEGTATVTATVNNHAATCTVTVVKATSTTG